MPPAAAMPTLSSRVEPVNAPHVALEGREVAYICLEDCDVWFLNDDHDDNFNQTTNKEQSENLSKKLTTTSWLDVAIPESHGGRTNLALEGSKDNTDAAEDACPHCHLILKSNKKYDGIVSSRNLPPPRLCLFANGPRFDGTIHDTKPNMDRCRCKSKRLRQRSDAALMVGLALTSHHLNQLRIQSIKVAARHSQSTPSSCLTRGPKTAATNAPMTMSKATILMTFSCLEIERTPTKNGAFEQRGVRRFVTNSNKPFPSSTQLLLCLMRSDWEMYDATIAKVENRHESGEGKDGGGGGGGASNRSQVSFFPSKMTLENAYQRIQGTSLLSELSAFDTEKPCERSNENEKNDEVPNITIPPEDVLVHIGSYLTAPSLYATRCTCKRLYRALRGVVPGMKLKLYRHQVKSLIWMRWRETKLLFESDLASIEHQTNVQSRTNAREADVHRAATGGASVVLCPRNTGEGVRISQANGDEMEVSEDEVMARQLARGGLLCDDPGLGKTITVLSLILQTMGLSTEKRLSQVDEKTSKETSSVKVESVDEQIFKAYWKENMVQEFRRQDLTKLFNAFLKSGVDVYCFLEKTDLFNPKGGTQNAVCLKDIKARIDQDDYGDSFEKFETDVRLCFMNAMLTTDPNHLVHMAAGRLIMVFGVAVKEFKQKKVQIARKSFSRSAKRPNSEVAAIVEKTNAERLTDALLPSSGTLLVVPAVLVDHWVEQIVSHVDPSYCTDKLPVICNYSGTKDSALKMKEIETQCLVEKTRFPFVLVDRTNHKALPPTSFLAMFKIVITTNQRFSNEWSNGSFENELERKDKESKTEGSLKTAEMYENSNEKEEASPLLKINWLRMIVDEGHSMGRGKDSSHISFASWVNAERRWAMTGTPTRQATGQTGLSNILNLMQYLNHDFFSRRHGGDVVWNQLVMRGWNRGLLSSFFRMRSLFSLLMVRHTKNDIEELPSPIYKTKILPMSQEEVTTYNTLCCAVQSNLLITSMEGKTSGAQDSLLHKSQTKHAIEAINNLRLVCVGGTQVRPTLTQKNWNEFLEMFDARNSDKKKRQEVRQFLSRATTGFLSSCNCCEMMLSSLLVFPCGHLVCTECVDNASTSCIVCDEEFDVDEFQKLQPGFVFEWLHNIEEESRLRTQGGGAQNGQEDAVGNAPANNPGGGNAPFNNVGNNINVAQLIQGGARTNRLGDGHICVYDPAIPGVCRLCFREHEQCYLVDEESQCQVCYRHLEDCPAKETKPHYVVKKLLSLYKEQQDAKASPLKFNILPEFKVGEKRPLKAIIFSQFRKTLNQTGDRLLRRLGSGCVAEYWGKYRKKELDKFKNDDKCLCMLLGKDGSEGLDLSFVTHIIFLEKIWDKSLESQAVSRAWRMGAKGAVEVENLIAQNSIEETMAELEKQLEHGFDADSDDAEGVRSLANRVKTSEYKRAKTHYLLKHLNLISDSSTLGFAARGKRKASELNGTTQESDEICPRSNKRSANINMSVRFQEQDETFEYDVN